MMIIELFRIIKLNNFKIIIMDRFINAIIITRFILLFLIFITIVLNLILY